MPIFSGQLLTAITREPFVRITWNFNLQGSIVHDYHDYHDNYHRDYHNANHDYHDYYHEAWTLNLLHLFHLWKHCFPYFYTNPTYVLKNFTFRCCTLLFFNLYSSLFTLVMEKNFSRRLTQPRPWWQFYLRTLFIPSNCYIFRIVTLFLVTPGMYILQNSEGYHIQINYYLHILLYSELEREREL